MSPVQRRMTYKLERDGRTVYCNSFRVVSALLALGWALIAPDHCANSCAEPAAGSPFHARPLGSFGMSGRVGRASRRYTLGSHASDPRKLDLRSRV